MTQPLAPQIRATPGSPASVRIGTVTGTAPLRVTVQGTVFNAEALGVLASYTPVTGHVVALLGQSSEASSDPTSWLVLGRVIPGA